MPFIPIIAAVGGAVIGSIGANKAAKTQANAATQASNTQLEMAKLNQQTQLHMYDTTRSDLMPYQQMGTSALSQLGNLWGLGPGGNGQPNAQAAMSQLTQFPGYQFGLSQGVSALDRSAASRGMTLSGAQEQAVNQFGQQYGMQQAWNPYISQLNSLSSLGENAAAQTGNAGTAAANGFSQAGTAGAAQAGQYQVGAGQAIAAGQVAQANQWQSLLQNPALQSGLSGLFGGGGGGGGSSGLSGIASLLQSSGGASTAF